MNNKYIVLGIVVLVVLIGGLYFLTMHKSEPTEASQPSDQAASSTVKNFALTVQNRKLVSGSPTLSVKQGDIVSITITADESDELHLHGYDKHVDFATDTPATLTFTADQSGRFPFEMEGSKTDLGEVDVQP